MGQLIFKFPFKTKYYEQDFYVSSNNFSAYKLIESWPNWPGQMVKYIWSERIRKNSFIKYFKKKISSVVILMQKKLMIKFINLKNFRMFNN